MMSNSCPNCGAEIPAQPTMNVKLQKTLLCMIAVFASMAVLGIGALLFILLRPSTSETNLPAVDPYNTVNLSFECVDATTNASLDDCQIHVRIIDEVRVTEFGLTPVNTQILIPIKRRLTVTAESSGYNRTSLIFEYTDNGIVQVKQIPLEPASP